MPFPVCRPLKEPQLTDGTYREYISALFRGANSSFGPYNTLKSWESPHFSTKIIEIFSRIPHEIHTPKLNVSFRRNFDEERNGVVKGLVGGWMYVL